jgi:hypothetical protein
MNESAGLVAMSKSMFWPMFKRAWDKAFTEDNIQSAFCKAGIWPTDSSYIIKTITRPVIASPEKSAGLRTPKSAKAIRRFYVEYDKEPTVDKVKKLFATTLHLSAQVSVLQHENKGLYKAIDLQKKKGRQGVRLNLAGQPNKDIVDCYSPAQVVKAREYQEEKEALKAAEEQAKFDRKIKRAANALKKKQEEEEKKKRKAEREAKATTNKPAKKAPKKKPVSTTTKAKNAAPTVSKSRKAPVKARLPPKSPVKRAVVVLAEEVVTRGVVVAKTSSRTINLPQRFR